MTALLRALAKLLAALWMLTRGTQTTYRAAFTGGDLGEFGLRLGGRQVRVTVDLIPDQAGRVVWVVPQEAQAGD